MNSSMVELSPSLQNLLDERLDAIERILLAVGVSRVERRGSVPVQQLNRGRRRDRIETEPRDVKKVTVNITAAAARD